MSRGFGRKTEFFCDLGPDLGLTGPFYGSLRSGLRRGGGFDPSTPTTFEKVDETFTVTFYRFYSL